MSLSGSLFIAFTGMYLLFLMESWGLMLFSSNFLINVGTQIQYHSLYHRHFCFGESLVLEEKDIKFITRTFRTECLEFPV